MDDAIKQLLTSASEQATLITQMSSALTGLNNRISVLEEALINFINTP
jgi:hypothetical protein